MIGRVQSRICAGISTFTPLSDRSLMKTDDLSTKVSLLSYFAKTFSQQDTRASNDEFAVTKLSIEETNFVFINAYGNSQSKLADLQAASAQNFAWKSRKIPVN